MRNAIVTLELQHFRIDEQQFYFVRTGVEQNAQQHRVQPHALAGSGRAGNQQVRHRSQVRTDRTAEDIFPEREPQFGA